MAPRSEHTNSSSMQLISFENNILTWMLQLAFVLAALLLVGVQNWLYSFDSIFHFTWSPISIVLYFMIQILGRSHLRWRNWFLEYESDCIDAVEEACQIGWIHSWIHWGLWLSMTFFHHKAHLSCFVAELRYTTGFSPLSFPMRVSFWYRLMFEYLL